MAKSKSKKTKKEEVQDAEFEDVKPSKQKSINMIDNSFSACINSITGIPAEIFGDIKTNIERSGVNAWHKPYIEVLKHHGFDMIFFAYGNPVVIGGDVTIEAIRWGNDEVQIPTGKCIMMGRDISDNFKCVTATMNDDFMANVIYDPYPEASFVEVLHIGFFIRTFMDTDTIIDVVKFEEGEPDDSTNS